MVGGGEGAFIGAVHRIAARLDDRFELVAGALSSDAARAKQSAADLHIDPERAYADFTIMAATEATHDDGIDAVAIVTPNHLHYSVANAFLEAGIHVICDKPLTTEVAEAENLARRVRETGLVFVLTHNYTGYPMVREARERIASGELGRIRVVQVEYPQDWLSTRLEDTGHKQAAWRTDPARSGPGGCVGDIGTHAANLAEFITGLRIEAVAVDLSSFVAGRALDDNVHMLLRLSDGAKGMLWSSQVAPGNENALRVRVFGDKAGLEWRQEHPNQLHVSPLGEPPRLVTRGSAGLGTAALRATRIPAGHPEGYLEGFAQLYSDAAEQITAVLEGREPDPLARLTPTVDDGVRGVKFIVAAVASSRADAAWTAL